MLAVLWWMLKVDSVMSSEKVAWVDQNELLKHDLPFVEVFPVDIVLTSARGSVIIFSVEVECPSAKRKSNSSNSQKQRFLDRRNLEFSDEISQGIPLNSVYIRFLQQLQWTIIENAFLHLSWVFYQLLMDPGGGIATELGCGLISYHIVCSSCTCNYLNAMILLTFL